MPNVRLHHEIVGQWYADLKVFVAGASGAIGLPLVAELTRRGHVVTGMTRDEQGAREIAHLGVTPVVADALDAQAVLTELKRFEPEIVINELTALPRNPAGLSAAHRADSKLRLIGNAHLQAAACACGVRRYVQQSSGFYLKTNVELADEHDSLLTDADAGIAASSRMYEQLEQETFDSSIEGTVLRYGFFYGHGTWYHQDGGAADQARRRTMPIVGDGAGVWSFVHVDDAAQATVAALTAAPGTYNIVDSNPSPLNVWLPRFAQAVGAPVPLRISSEEGRASGGEDAVYTATKLKGASNAKARTELQWIPRRLEWLEANASCLKS